MFGWGGDGGLTGGMGVVGGKAVVTCDCIQMTWGQMYDNNI